MSCALSVPPRRNATMSPNAREKRRGGLSAEVIDLCSQNSATSSDVAETEGEGMKKRAALPNADTNETAAAASGRAAADTISLDPPPSKRAKPTRACDASNFVDLTGEDDDDDGSNGKAAETKEQTAATKTNYSTRESTRDADLSAVAARARKEPPKRTPDGVTVTAGIVAILRARTLDKTNIRACGLCLATDTPTAAVASSSSSSATAQSQSRSLLPMHYRQRDRWSCGYRNTQMMLSSLIPLLPPDHPYFEIVPSRSSSMEPPALRDIQGLLEQTWREGFDPKGREHYRGRIRGRSEWIGAVEVASVLWYLSIDSAVVQFLQRTQSTRMLADFLWTYFSNDSGFDTCEHSAMEPARGRRRGPNVMQLTESILNQCAFGGDSLSNAAASPATGTRSSADSHCIASPLVPVYLQWRGHSVTVMGIERVGESHNLLLLDPGKTIGDIGWSGRDAGGDPSILLDAIRKPASELYHADCQIVVSGSVPLSRTERMERKGDNGVNRFVFTARG